MTAQAVTAALVGTQVYTYTSAAMANGDTTVGISIPDFADKTVAFTGTAGAAAAISLEGSNDPLSVADASATWFVLKDPSSTAITLSAAGMRLVLEHPLRIRGHVSAGDGTTSIVMVVMARRGSR